MQNLLTLTLLALAVLSGIILLGHWQHFYGGGRNRREIEQRKSAELAAGAASCGWIYDGCPQGTCKFRVFGRSMDGLYWTIQYDAGDACSYARPQLVFQVSALAPRNSAWAILDRPSYLRAQRPTVRAIVGELTMIIGAFVPSVADWRLFYLNATVQIAGSSAFQRRYVVAAVTPAWTTILDEETERLILNFPFFIGTMDDTDNCFSASFTPAGLRVQLYCEEPDFPVIKHLQTIGTGLMANSRRVETPQVAWAGTETLPLVA